MYDFIYVDPHKMSVEDHFIAITFFVDYKKMSNPVTVPKHWLGFSYIRSEDYELDENFDDTELKNNQNTRPTIKLNYFSKVLWSLRRNDLII